ncbi:MAG TPA: 5'-methylthioadenosine/S-adenosylhomocysteine nucleosidase [Syntrophorhabdaceae bacterium]|nr:5'-methylthioadenosine/S-adenosylhomocysteine nucleosidase [Syntrophorhabdaceae bacterium]
MIGIVMATMLEADPFLATLSLKEMETSPFRFYGNDDILLIISGIGKTNSAMATTYLIQNFKPKCICNLGAAGATNNQCQLGEYYQISEIVEPDRPDLRTGIPHRHKPDVLDYSHTVVLATQDKPVHSSVERKKIAKLAQLVDMEGAAVTQVCRQFHVKCLIFKFVSDTPEHHLSRDIIENIKHYREDFARFFSQSILPALLSSFQR